MSYYILPKNNNAIVVNPCTDEKKDDEIIISYSLYHYYHELYKYASNIYTNVDLSCNSCEEILKILNPYSFLFNKVPGSKFSVSKLKSTSNIFYDLIEISVTLNLFEIFNDKSIDILNITKNLSDITDFYKVARENYADNIISFENIDNHDAQQKLENKKFNFVFFETNNNNTQNYIRSFIEAVMSILRYQHIGGISIIKISNIFHKSIIDIVYFLTSLFEKVYVIKPNTSIATSFDEYIVCNNFISNQNNFTHNKLNYYKLFVFLKKNENKNILSLLDIEIPYYFMSKLSEMNNIIGQQILESLDQIISILKSKNKEDKLDIIKKTNIQKSIKWCEKYKIPCNKFTEKMNIFLTNEKEDTID